MTHICSRCEEEFVRNPSDICIQCEKKAQLDMQDIRTNERDGSEDWVNPRMSLDSSWDHRNRVDAMRRKEGR